MLLPHLFAILAILAAGAPLQSAPGGTGPFPAVMETDPGLPAHTLYRPANLEAKGLGKLPIVAWANGACSDNGASFKPFLTEIASHGYLVIALGAPGKVPEIQPPPDAPYSTLPRPANAPNPEGPGPGTDPTQPSQLIDAIDWAIAENGRHASAFANRLQTGKIAVMGQSCGGLQALAVSDDPRISTQMIWNSGIYNRGQGRSGVVISKEKLKTIHGPIAYVIGGPGDIAYENAVDDFARIDKVPVLIANLDVGHGGTYRQANGGKFATVGVSWLDWRLKGDRDAAAMFVGPKCGLCVNPEWTVQKKKID